MIDNPTVKNVMVVNPKLDEDEQIGQSGEAVKNDYDPTTEGGGEVMDIDEERRLTGTEADDDPNTQRKPLQTAEDLNQDSKLSGE